MSFDYEQFLASVAEGIADVLQSFPEILLSEESVQLIRERTAFYAEQLALAKFGALKDTPDEQKAIALKWLKLSARTFALRLSNDVVKVTKSFVSETLIPAAIKAVEAYVTGYLNGVVEGFLSGRPMGST